MIVFEQLTSTLKRGDYMKSYKIKLGLLLFTFLFIFAACAKDEPNEKTADGEKESETETEIDVSENTGGTLNVAINAQPPTLDQPITNASSTRDVSRLMFEGLVTT